MVEDKEFLEVWERECRMALEDVTAAPHPSIRGEWALDAAQRLLAVARHLNEVACQTCGGYGHRSYADTSGWRGGGGGQSITVGICDKCWGSGRNDKTGPNLRRLGPYMKALQTKSEGPKG